MATLGTVRRFTGIGGRPAPIRAARHAGDDYGSTAEPNWRDVNWSEHLHDWNGINYVDYGPRDSDKEAVVFIHGLGGCWQNWLEQLPRAAQERRVIAMDLPGFAGSRMPDGEISITNYARTVHELCDHAGLDRVELVGNSMGGFISLEIGIRHPERVDSITVVSAAGISTTNLEVKPVVTFARSTAAITNFFISRAEQFVKRPRMRHLMMSYVFRHPTLIQPDLAFEIMRGSGSDGFIPALTALAEYDYSERLPEVQEETLLVWGEEDNLVPVEDATRYEELIPNARKVVIDDTGHCAMIERPQMFNDLMMRFLDDGLAALGDERELAGYGTVGR